MTYSEIKTLARELASSDVVVSPDFVLKLRNVKRGQCLVTCIPSKISQGE